MPHVRRIDGRITEVHLDPAEGLEPIAPESPELAAFLRRVAAGADWIESDLGMVRVLEDLLDVLIDRQVIRFTDLPEAAQRKLMDRRGLRREFAYVAALFGDGDPFDPGGGTSS